MLRSAAMKLLLIGIAGGCGVVLRYLVVGWGQRLVTGAFPLGTLIVNVVGCLLIGILGGVLTGTELVRDEVRLALIVGLLGGFTTFSAFGFETAGLLSTGRWGTAVANVVLSNGLGVMAVWLGLRLAEPLHRI
jgi:CrcB protein